MKKKCMNVCKIPSKQNLSVSSSFFFYYHLKLLKTLIYSKKKIFTEDKRGFPPTSKCISLSLNSSKPLLLSTPIFIPFSFFSLSN